MPPKDAMPLIVAFHTRSESIYNSMRARFREKRNKKGRIFRHGRVVPFTLAEFREWLRQQLGGKDDGSAQCAYCRTPLFADTARIDHPDPVSRGGGLGFENLCCSCDSCNRLKGQLTAAEFKSFMGAMDEMLHKGALGPAGYQDVMKRLKGQVLKFRTFQAKKKQESGVLRDNPEQLGLITRKSPPALTDDW